MYVAIINQPDAEHLEEVKAEMQILGAPVIRAIRDDGQGIILALEGSHRLAAAQMLGLRPVLQLVADDALLTCDELGFDDMGWFEGEPARAIDIRNHIARPNGTYRDCEWRQYEDGEIEIREAA